MIAGGGEHVRNRVCKNDAAFCVGDNKNHPSCVCEGESQESGVCNEYTCPQWSEWGPWGDCPVSCGGGAKERKRTCDVDEAYCSSAPGLKR